MWAFGRYRIKTQKNSNIITEIKDDFVMRAKVSREFKSAYDFSSNMVYKIISVGFIFDVPHFLRKKTLLCM